MHAPAQPKQARCISPLIADCLSSNNNSVSVRRSSSGAAKTAPAFFSPLQVLGFLDTLKPLKVKKNAEVRNFRLSQNPETQPRQRLPRGLGADQRQPLPCRARPLPCSRAVDLVRSIFKQGSLQDITYMVIKLRQLLGDCTFLEAYERTGE
jgi:hypothetical protein